MKRYTAYFSDDLLVSFGEMRKINEAIANSDAVWQDLQFVVEFTPGDVWPGENGLYHDVTEQACREYLKAYRDEIEYDWDGQAMVPDVVRQWCGEEVAELEGERAFDWEAEERSHHMHSVGVGLAR